jgi:hypothetical protein
MIASRAIEARAFAAAGPSGKSRAGPNAVRERSRTIAACDTITARS